MELPWKLLGKKPKGKLVQATDADINYARQFIDSTFANVIARELESLNNKLESKGIRVGIDVKYYFDKVVEEGDGKDAVSVG